MTCTAPANVRESWKITQSTPPEHTALRNVAMLQTSSRDAVESAPTIQPIDVADTVLPLRFLRTRDDALAIYHVEPV